MEPVKRRMLCGNLDRSRQSAFGGTDGNGGAEAVPSWTRKEKNGISQV